MRRRAPRRDSNSSSRKFGEVDRFIHHRDADSGVGGMKEQGERHRPQSCANQKGSSGRSRKAFSCVHGTGNIGT